MCTCICVCVCVCLRGLWEISPLTSGDFSGCRERAGAGLPVQREPISFSLLLWGNFVFNFLCDYLAPLLSPLSPPCLLLCIYPQTVERRFHACSHTSLTACSGQVSGAGSASLCLGPWGLLGMRVSRPNNSRARHSHGGLGRSRPRV
jgi:hypothetical protein